MRLYLGLGSNQGDRKKNLAQALGELAKIGQIEKISPFYETPALLPENAAEDWNRSFLNLAASFTYQESLERLLRAIKEIETKLGRANAERWSPRPIDIDILHSEEGAVARSDLTVPHREASRRAFVLDPLKDLSPRLRLGDFTVRELARKHEQHQPLWMKIVNLTPDSFSDGGSVAGIDAFSRVLDETEEYNIQILDVGAESTRPGARLLAHDEEWQRLKPFLECFHRRYRGQPLRPRLSVDTRNVRTAERCLELGADYINDVSGLADPAMLSLLKSSSCKYILMHSLTVPADPKKTFAAGSDVVSEIKMWLKEKLEVLEAGGVALDRVVFDPGIGFGKTALQSQILLKNIEAFYGFDIQVLVGHSRKSFMKSFTSRDAFDRDVETLGGSFELARKGVDILRVHNTEIHARAFLSRGHIV